VAERNHAAVHIQLVFGDAEFAHRDYAHCSEGFVDFKQVDIGRSQVLVCQQLPYGLDTAAQHLQGIGCDGSRSHDARAWLHAVARAPRIICNQH
jgi:hypothetical protein